MVSQSQDCPKQNDKISAETEEHEPFQNFAIKKNITFLKLGAEMTCAIAK